MCYSCDGAFLTSKSFFFQAGLQTFRTPCPWLHDGRRIKGWSRRHRSDVVAVWRFPQRLGGNVEPRLDHFQVLRACRWSRNTWTVGAPWYRYHLTRFLSPQIVSCVNILTIFFQRGKTHLFEEFLFSWEDRLRREDKTMMTVKLLKDIAVYKVRSAVESPAFRYARRSCF